MITFPFVSIRNLLIITPKNLYFSRLKVNSTDYGVEDFKSYKTYVEVFENERIDEDLIIVFNNNSSFEDEVEIEPYLDDETIIKDALESEIKKKSTINSNILFHYLKVKSDFNKEKHRYKLFGFDRDAYNTLLESIPNKSSLSLITTAETLLFNYCQTFISKPYIALYRFHNQDILIVSDTNNLLFSRSHFEEESNLNSTIRSIEYVKQRFKDYSFEIYVGGNFIDSSVKASLQESLESSIEILQKSSYPLFLKGIKNLPKIYNFIPKQISVKRLVNKLRDSLMFVAFFIFLVSVMSFFVSYSDYKSSLTVYQNMDKEYKSELKSLNLIGHERLNQLSKIKKLQSLDNLRYFKQLLETIKPISQKMSLLEFSWENKKRGDTVDIIMTKAFKTLSELDSFLLTLEKHIEMFKKKLPKIVIQKDIDLKNLNLNIGIHSIKNKRKLSTYKMENS